MHWLIRLAERSKSPGSSAVDPCSARYDVSVRSSTLAHEAMPRAGDEICAPCFRRLLHAPPTPPALSAATFATRARCLMRVQPTALPVECAPHAYIRAAIGLRAAH